MRRQQRTTFILAAVAAVLLGFVWFYERHTLTSKELEGRHGKLLDRFVRARLTKIEVQRHGETFVIERRREDEDEAGDGPFWGLARPVRAEADDDAVSAMLSELEYLEARRTLEGIGASDRHRMGLDHPRVRVWLTVAGERQALVVGGEDTRDEGVFVATGDITKAYVVGKDLFEALDKGANDFRDKRLFGTGASVRVADDVVLRGGPDGELHLTRTGTRWSFEGTLAGWASRDALETLLGAVDDLRATRFVADDARDLAHYGLDPAHLEVVARVPPSVTEDAGTGTPHTLRFRIGGPCAGHDGERYALATRDGHDGPVVCATTTDLEAKLTEPATSLRDARLVTRDNEEVDHVTVESGRHRLAVRREGDGFRYAVDGSHDEQGASQEGIAHWLDALRALRATEFVPVATDAHGTDHPRATLVVSAVQGADEERVLLGASDLSGTWVRRGDEPVVLHVGAEAEELLAPDPVVIRGPAALHDDESAVTEVGIALADGPTIHLVKNGDAWEATAPAGATPNVDAVRALLRLATTLEAVRWAASSATPRMGFAHPSVVLTLRGATAGANTVRTIRVGAATAGGAYVQLDADPAVLVVSDAMAAEVARLLEPPDAGTAPPPAPPSPPAPH